MGSIKIGVLLDHASPKALYNSCIGHLGREIPWWSDFCEGDKPFIENGWMAVSDRPGIGVELND